jgi:hypothetical protein
VPSAAYPHRRTPAAPSSVSENQAVSQQTRTTPRDKVFFEVP